MDSSSTHSACNILSLKCWILLSYLYTQSTPVKATWYILYRGKAGLSITMIMPCTYLRIVSMLFLLLFCRFISGHLPGAKSIIQINIGSSLLNFNPHSCWLSSRQDYKYGSPSASYHVTIFLFPANCHLILSMSSWGVINITTNSFSFQIYVTHPVIFILW